MRNVLLSLLMVAAPRVRESGVGGSAGSGPFPACELLAPAEVAKVLGAPRAFIDSLNSGPNEATGAQLCSWYVRQGSSEGVMIKLYRGASPDQAGALWYGSVRMDGDWLASDSDPVRVTGVGDEALYRRYASARGGTLIVRKGLDVFLLTGSPSREGLTALAKLVAGRLR
jgi:hypothetical protein